METGEKAPTVDCRCVLWSIAPQVREPVAFTGEPGDLLVLDHMVAPHALPLRCRAEGTGEMAEPVNREQV